MVEAHGARRPEGFTACQDPYDASKMLQRKAITVLLDAERLAQGPVWPLPAVHHSRRPCLVLACSTWMPSDSERRLLAKGLRSSTGLDLEVIAFSGHVVCARCGCWRPRSSTRRCRAADVQMYSPCEPLKAPKRLDVDPKSGRRKPFRAETGGTWPFQAID